MNDYIYHKSEKYILDNECLPSHTIDNEDNKDSQETKVFYQIEIYLKIALAIIAIIVSAVFVNILRIYKLRRSESNQGLY